MKKNPIHFYWGRKNGLIVTREEADGSNPEVVFVSNALSLDRLKKAGIAALARRDKTLAHAHRRAIASVIVAASRTYKAKTVCKLKTACACRIVVIGMKRLDTHKTRCDQCGHRIP